MQGGTDVAGEAVMGELRDPNLQPPLSMLLGLPIHLPVQRAWLLGSVERDHPMQEERGELRVWLPSEKA